MYPVADMLTTIMNAHAVNKESVVLPFSRMKFDIANTLKAGGYVSAVERKKRKAKKSEQEFISIILKYDEHGPAINNLQLINPPLKHM